MHISAFRGLSVRGRTVKGKDFQSRKGVSGVPRLDPKSQLLLAVSILVGIFFLEYPPIFALGYWSWGAALHKTLTGALLVLNLVVAQYATRR